MQYFMHLRLLESINSKTNDLKNQPVFADVLVYFKTK